MPWPTAQNLAIFGRLTNRNIHIAELEVPDNSAWAGRRLCELAFSHEDGVMIAAIVRGAHRINVPDGEAMIFPTDRIEVIGSDDSLQHFQQRMQSEQTAYPLAARPFAVAPTAHTSRQSLYRPRFA